MTAPATEERHMNIGRLPHGWVRADRPGLFQTDQFGAGVELFASVRVFEPLASSPDYLLTRFGATTDGPLGRPRVESLPESLEEGVSIIAFEEEADGALVARIDLLRRAWNLDIVVSARTAEIVVVESLYFAMLELLASVQPMGENK